MAEYKLLLPSMGEGVMEATIINWIVNEGDTVNEDDSVVEIATDKVDSDVPTPVSGKVIRILKQKDDIAQVGEPIALLEIADNGQQMPAAEETTSEQPHTETTSVPEPNVIQTLEAPLKPAPANSDIYLSPLVKSVISEEKITGEELATIQGSGLGGRITKEDILGFVKTRQQTPQPLHTQEQPAVQKNNPKTPAPAIPVSAGDEIVEMDRMRKLIAENMVRAKQIAPHVTSFIETDVTNVVRWRNQHKDTFLKREGEKLTFMPVFIRAVVKAIQDFPNINVSVDGERIIRRKNISIGMATALPDGNLIVPVIKNADQLSLSGLAKAVNDLAYRARNRKLKPEDTQGATYTISNIGSFGNLMGTPIIPQPQVAILAVGAIVKKPSVLETPDGDVIAIRNQMFMSHSYDHRVVDGSLGGLFLKSVHDYLQNWDLDTEI
ncbi:dihydrolipoamide acetyltransferase family protein [Weeksellaceae bacterium A-14]|uniref:dihydrolipoamide acetyltransferase family protein n=1 Tax=Daejeonia sp. YH14 TaxID=3439042 RepID=UPI0031E4D36B